MEVIKIQRPLNKPADGHPWLIYAKGREKMQMMWESNVPDHVLLGMRGENKAYFLGHWHPKHEWTVLERVSDDQDF